MADVPTGFLGKLTAIAATIGAFIAVGQAGSEWVRSYYMAAIEEKRAEQQVLIEQIKAESDLAKDYLTIIFDPTTSSADRLALLGAISTLATHPLREWATEQYKTETARLDDLDRARKRQLETIQAGTADDIEAVKREIDVAKEEYESVRNDPEKSRISFATLLRASQRLGLLKGKQAEVIATARVHIEHSTSNVNDQMIVSLDRLTVEAIKAALPYAPTANIERNLPAINAALQEFDLVDPSLVAATVAAISAETAGFEPIAEKVSKYNTEAGMPPFSKYEARSEIGNSQPGDGERFKGRGYVQLTGRANYRRYGELLGIPLEENPELAADPEIAARILGASISEKREAIRMALDAGDLTKARRLVSGGSHGMDRFEGAYLTLTRLIKDQPR
jgi:predicted chitinase